MRVCKRERHGELEETVAETDPWAGAVWPTYRNARRGSKTIQTLGMGSLTQTSTTHYDV